MHGWIISNYHVIMGEMDSNPKTTITLKKMPKEPYTNIYMDDSITFTIPF